MVLVCKFMRKMVGNIVFRSVSFHHLTELALAKRTWESTNRNVIEHIKYIRLGSIHKSDTALGFVHSRHRRRWIASWRRSSTFLPTFHRLTEVILAGAVLPSSFVNDLSILPHLHGLELKRCCCEGITDFSNVNLRIKKLCLKMMCWHDKNQDLDMICSCQNLISLSITWHNTMSQQWVWSGKKLPTTVEKLALSASRSFWTNVSPPYSETIDCIFTLFYQFPNLMDLTLPDGMGCMPHNLNKHWSFGKNIRYYFGPVRFLPYITSKSTLLTDIHIVNHCFHTAFANEDVPKDLIVENLHVNVSIWDSEAVRILMERIPCVKRLSLKWDWIPRNIVSDTNLSQIQFSCHCYRIKCTMISSVTVNIYDNYAILHYHRLLQLKKHY